MWGLGTCARAGGAARCVATGGGEGELCFWGARASGGGGGGGGKGERKKKKREPLLLFQMSI